MSALDNAKAALAFVDTHAPAFLLSDGATVEALRALIVEHERVLAERAAPQEWEYGVANFGDIDDVMQKPETVTDKTDREWAEAVIQREYGDSIVRRRKASDWEPLPEATNQTEGENR
jgi:hypothetical protein